MSYRALFSTAPEAPLPLGQGTGARFWLSGLIATLSVAALVTATDAQAQWRWRDASGRVTASDMPPPREVAEKDILSRPTLAPAARNRGFVPLAAASGAAGAASGAGPGRSPLQTEVEARRKAQEQEAAAKAKADEERQATQRAENCRRARNQVATLDSGIRLQRLNARGEREVLDEAARAEEMKAARATVASECK